MPKSDKKKATAVIDEIEVTHDEKKLKSALLNKTKDDCIPDDVKKMASLVESLKENIDAISDNVPDDVQKLPDVFVKYREYYIGVNTIITSLSVLEKHLYNTITKVHEKYINLKEAQGDSNNEESSHKSNAKQTDNKNASDEEDEEVAVVLSDDEELVEEVVEKKPKDKKSAKKTEEKEEKKSAKKTEEKVVKEEKEVSTKKSGKTK